MEAGKGARERKKPARPRRTVLAIVIVCCRLRWRLERRARSSWTAELVDSKMLAQSRSSEMPPPRYLRTVEGGDWGRRTF